MRDLGGRPYRRLKNAFAYRKTYNPSCGCRPKPWSERARLRHKRYGAVGKERRQLAIRSIRLDLRSTIKPSVTPKLVLASSSKVVKGLNDPTLPVRRPALRYVTEKAMPSGHGTLKSTGAIEETAAVAGPVGHDDGAIQSKWQTPKRHVPITSPSYGSANSGVRILSFGDLRNQYQSRSVRVSSTVPQSRLVSPSEWRASVAQPVVLQLRSGLN